MRQNFILIYKNLKLNSKNILVNLKYLNSIKFQSGRLDRIWPNFCRHKLTPIWPNLGLGRLDWIRVGLIRSNLAKISTYLTGLNFTKFWLGPTLLQSTNFGWGRLSRILPNFSRDWIDQISFGVYFTKFQFSLTQLNFSKFWLRSIQLNFGRYCLNWIIIGVNSTKFRVMPNRPNFAKFRLGSTRPTLAEF